MTAKPIIKSKKSALFYAAVLIPVVLFGVMVAVRQIRQVLAKVLLIHESSVTDNVERGLFGITR